MIIIYITYREKNEEARPCDISITHSIFWNMDSKRQGLDQTLFRFTPRRVVYLLSCFISSYANPQTQAIVS